MVNGELGSRDNGANEWTMRGHFGTDKKSVSGECSTNRKGMPGGGWDVLGSIAD